MDSDLSGRFRGGLEMGRGMFCEADKSVQTIAEHGEVRGIGMGSPG